MAFLGDGQDAFATLLGMDADGCSLGIMLPPPQTTRFHSAMIRRLVAVSCLAQQ